jgi:hypothetical protein
MYARLNCFSSQHIFCESAVSLQVQCEHLQKRETDIEKIFPEQCFFCGHYRPCKCKPRNMFETFQSVYVKSTYSCGCCPCLWQTLFCLPLSSKTILVTGLASQSRPWANLYHGTEAFSGSAAFTCWFPCFRFRYSTPVESSSSTTTKCATEAS